MAEYVVKRLMQGALVVLAVTLVLFLIMQLMPGDPILLICGDRVPQETQLAVRREWGLDQPLYVQYARWLSHAVSGDFGQSTHHADRCCCSLPRGCPSPLMLSGIALGAAVPDRRAHRPRRGVQAEQCL
jgi:peptide/nickel transport system permease protein